MNAQNFSMNKVTLIGNLGFDPQKSDKETAPVNLRIVTNKGWKDKASGEWKNVGTWHNVSVWGASRDWAMSKLHKGDTVSVEGEIVTNSFKDKEGNDRTSNDIKAINVSLVQSKMNGGGSGSTGGQTNSGSNKGTTAPDDDFQPPF